MKHYIQDIQNASVYDIAKKTPLDAAPKLSHRFKNTILIKREDLQSVFSFKLRGAYNKLSQLTELEKKNGVIAASAGNHAQGVALSAKHLGIEALIVMPQTTPSIKVKAVQSHGAKTLLVGDAYDDAYTAALEISKEKNLTFIHPYDDPSVIAGQGTVAMEIFTQHPQKIDAIFVPVGGGGLLAGIAVYAHFLHPDTQVIGVEAEDSASMTQALAQHERIILDRVGIFADGVAVKQAGKEPFRIASQTVKTMITVTTDEICAAVKDIFDDTRAIAEPAGALALAGAKKYAEQTGIKGQTWVVINSGANINFDRLRHIAERAEIGEHREGLLAVTIAETPGSFKAFCKLLGKRSITEFNYRYSSPKEAHIFVGLELGKGREEKEEIIEKLKQHKYPVIDLTDNEMAKLHIRHMVGGRAQNIPNETLYRFEFPERPGALIQFLEGIGQGWNITLFHYRNHGSAFGRVLVGIDAPPTEREKLNQYFTALGYPYTEESNNPAYHLFL